MTTRHVLGCALFLSVLASLGAEPLKKPAPPKVEPERRFAETLEKTVEFSGIDDPKTTLEEALAKLSKRYNLDFDINERAFQFEQINEVRKTEIARPDPIPPRTASLRSILESILNRIPVPTGATIMIRRDHIEITTETFAQNEAFGGSVYTGPLHPLVSADFEETPFSKVCATLASRGRCNVVLDPKIEKKDVALTLRLRNVPSETAIFLVAEMAGLVSVPRHNVFYLTSAERAKEIRKAMRQHDKMLPKREPMESDPFGGFPGGQ